MTMPRATWPKTGEVYQCRHNGRLYRFWIAWVQPDAVGIDRSVRGRNRWEWKRGFKMRPAIFRRQARKGGLKLCRA